jgi:hypothetical protein
MRRLSAAFSIGLFVSTFSTGAGVSLAETSITGHRGRTDAIAGPARVHPLVHRSLSEQEANGPVNVWVFLANKGPVTARGYEEALAKIASGSDPRTAERRRARRTRPGLFDYDDLPVHDPYLNEIRSTGAQIRVTSRWLNAVSVRATAAEIADLAALPFVESIQLVRQGRRVAPDDPPQAAAGLLDPGMTSSARTLDYGLAEPQLSQINLIALHDLGYTGAGVVVGLLDSGFDTSHVAFNHPDKPATVLAAWDFVNDDPNVGYEPGDPPTQHHHGTETLSEIGAYAPGEYIGGAFDASFILCKTEDDTDEYRQEEDFWVAGLEFIESQGGDVATSSLGYVAWYDPPDFNGTTAVTSIAVNVATGNGMYVCNSAGNNGNDTDPGTLHLDTPSDAFKIFACGSVTNTGMIAGSSSDGPTADGRVKPELLARGVNTWCVAPGGTTGYSTHNGTSFAVPLLASTVACLVQAHPTWTVDQMRTYLFRSGDYYLAHGTFEPNYVRGYGIFNAVLAHEGDCNNNGTDDAAEIDLDPTLDCNTNGVPDECDIDVAGDGRDCNVNGIPDECDIASGFSPDDDGDGVPDECCTPDAPAADPALARSRFLTFVADQTDQLQAIRVTYVDLPEPFNALNGQQMWVNTFELVSENAGVRPPAEAPTWPTTVIATLGCAPYYTRWSQYDSVHIYGDAIVPGGSYEIQAITVGCAADVEENFSTPLDIGTSRWGDLVGHCATVPCTPPNGTVDVTTDVTAVLDKFKNLPDAPSKTRCDLEPEEVDLLINISDVTYCLDAFRGFSYPFDTVPSPCPVTVR